MKRRIFSILWAAMIGCTLTWAQADNGITVGKVKIYDDQALQQALNAARSQLAAIQAMNGSALNAQVGTLQGSTLSQSAFAFTAGTAPTPGVQTTANTGNTTTTGASGLSNQANSGNTVTTTANGTTGQNTVGAGTTTSTAPGTGGAPAQTTTGGTTSTQTQTGTSNSTNLAVTGPSTQATTTNSNQTQTVGPSVQTVTTQASNTATAPTITPTTLTLPSQYSPGASAVLNEQLELTYEITGYELLLEGALSDHYLRYKPDSSGGTSQLVRPRATIGIPVTINPRKGDENAVAEIIVEVRAANPVVANEAPIVTAIMPRDKTYNVAALTDKSISVGGAVAVQVISLGVSALWGHKSEFVVQDQDTVALQLPSSMPGTVRFGWIIKPVLGQSVITSGMRNCFVQLAFPELPGDASYGSITVTTHWKKYDTKHGVVIDETPPHARPEGSAGPFDIENLKLKPLIGAATYEDNADGTVAVVASGDFLSGTFAQVGTSQFVPGVNGTVKDPSGIRFVLPAIQLATHEPEMIDRSGESTPIVNVQVATLHKTDACVSIGPKGSKTVQAEPAGAGLTKLTVPIQIANSQPCGANGTQSATAGRDLVAVVGNQVFGLRNQPFLSTADDQLVFLVPTSLLQSSRRVTVKRLLWGPAFDDGADLPPDTFKATPVVGQASVVEQSKDLLEIALTGTGLKDLQALVPAKVSWVTQKDFGAIFSVARSDVKDVKQLVLQDSAGELFFVTLPADAATPTAPTLDPVNKGTATITIPAGGQDLDTLTDVTYQGKSLHPKVAADRKSVTIEATEVTTTAGSKKVTFVFKNGKDVDFTITVVDLAVESIPAPAAPAAK